MLSASHDVTTNLVNVIVVSSTVQEVLDRVEMNLSLEERISLVQEFPVIGDLFRRDIPRRKRGILSERVALARLLAVYLRFLDSVATANRPVVVFLDDLQWADDTSRELVDCFLKDDVLANILIVGTTREDSNAIPKQTSSVFITVLALGNLEEVEVILMVSNALQMTPAETEDLGQLVYKRTKGNPCLVLQFLESLRNDGLLTNGSDDGAKVSWDVSVITLRTKPYVAVATELVDTVTKLDRNVKLVLAIAATIGQTFTDYIIEPIAASMDMVSLFPIAVSLDSESEEEIGGSLFLLTAEEISKSLVAARQANLIEPAGDGRYRFVHELVQNEARSLFPIGDRGKLINYTVGKLLLELYRNYPEENLILFSATQLIFKYGTGRVSRELVARLCVESVEKCMQQGAFARATQFAEAGDKAIGESAWGDSPTFSRLQNLAAESHFADGRYVFAKRRIAAIRLHSRSQRDQFRAFVVLLRVLVAEENYTDVMFESHKALSVLGISISEHPSAWFVAANVAKARRILDSQVGGDLTNLPTMENSTMQKATCIMFWMARAAWLSGDNNRFILCTLRAFQTVMQYGQNSDTPDILALVGIVLANLGEMTTAFELGRTASNLSCRQVLVSGRGQCEIICQTLLHLGTSLKESKVYCRQAIQTSLDHGHTDTACQLKMRLSRLAVFTGIDDTFEEQERRLEEHLRFTVRYSGQASHSVLSVLAQFVENVRGKARNPTILTGSHLDEARVLVADYDRATSSSKAKPAARHTGKLLQQVRALDCMRVVLLYLLGEHDRVEAHRKQTTKNRPPECGVTIQKYFHTTFLALNSYALAAQRFGRQRQGRRRWSRNQRKHWKIANQYAKEVECMGAAGSPTYAAVSALLDAERLATSPQRPNTTTSAVAPAYGRAIALLGDEQLPLLQAIAYERLGLLYLKNNDDRNNDGDDDDDTESNEQCKAALQEAWQTFRAQGAIAKLDRMRVDYGHIHGLYLT